MATWTNTNKNTVSTSNTSKNTVSALNVSKNSITVNNLSKNNITVSDQLKSANAWRYNQPTITYSGNTESSTNQTIYYNSLGLLTAWSNLAKS